MNIQEAIESTKMSLAQGDEMMKSKTWNGGGFKSEAIRKLLPVVEAAIALASVFPDRCVGAPEAEHPTNCACGQVVLDSAIRGDSDPVRERRGGAY